MLTQRREEDRAPAPPAGVAAGDAVPIYSSSSYLAPGPNGQIHRSPRRDQSLQQALS